MRWTELFAAARSWDVAAVDGDGCGRGCCCGVRGCGVHCCGFVPCETGGSLLKGNASYRKTSRYLAPGVSFFVSC